ncbi:SICA antigen [Plasmodium coatneyi]|uniref:SICA antigen n=1 Tax=Plasmodium coatneyi TaxID=208452 RepID=A0A1B1E402_9APIC|nr:SICA antigen [Plasmodium coatneyi]ANQ09754.1 SICA antigen [Plasmodium coatneyi]
MIEEGCIECTDKDTSLCVRAKCVTGKWLTNRPRRGPEVMWGPGDIGADLKKLSNAMTTNSESMGDECQDFAGKISTNNSAHKKACEYIVKGLRHTYKIEKEREENAEDNQLFKRTMSCALLNAYADLLQEKAKDTCPITDQNIKDMFSKGNEKKEDWCKEGGGDCVECRRDKTYESCMIGDSKNQTNVKSKVNQMLNEDQGIQKTLSTIDILCKDCSKETGLCARVDCVTKKWGVHKGKSPTWENMQKDIERRAKDMFEHIFKNSKNMEPYCSKLSNEDSRIVTDPEIKACHYITAGLKHMYEIQDDKKDKVDEKRKAKDDRIFKQTMECLLLNAYADELRKHVTSPCEVSEQTIKQAFNRGNGQITKWCKEGPSNCIRCEWDAEYKNCQIGKSGEEEEQQVGPKLHNLLSQNKEKENLDQGISSIKNLCDRAQCAITQRTRDRRTEGTANWENQIWDTDVKNRLIELSKAMAQGNGIDASLCEQIPDGNNATPGSHKKACQYITKGLQHIYGIGVDNKDKPDHKENNRIFKQTMTCLALNVFANEILGEKCSIQKEEIKKAFEAGGSPYNQLCPKGSMCEKCEWDECADFIIVGQGKRPKIKGELEKNKDINQILEKICPKDEPQAAAKPAATKPAPSAPEGRNDSSAGEDIPPAPGPVSQEPQQVAKKTEESPDAGTGTTNVQDDKLNGQKDPEHQVGGGGTGLGSGSADAGDAVSTGLLGDPSVGTVPQGGSAGVLGGLVPGARGVVPAVPDVGGVPGQRDSSPAQGPAGPPGSASSPGGAGGEGGGSSGNQNTGSPRPGTSKSIINKDKDRKITIPPYEVPIIMGLSAMSYFLCKYFFLRKRRKRYRRGYEGSGTSLQEQIIQHVEEDGPHEYTLVKERHPPRSAPTRTKSPPKRAAGHRMIIDIHLEVLDECQEGDSKLVQQDFFEILVQELMGNEFIKEDSFPKEVVFKEDVPKEQIQCSDSGFREEDFVHKEDVPMEDVPKEQIQCSDSRFREEDSVHKEDVPEEQVPSSDSGFRKGRLCS